MSFFSFRLRPVFRTLAVIATCFWLTLIVAYVADRLTRRAAPVVAAQVPLVETKPTEPAAPPATPAQVAESLDHELYGYSRQYRDRIRFLMRQGDAALLCRFRTDFMEEFKSYFGPRVSVEERADPDPAVILSAVLASAPRTAAQAGATDASAPALIDPEKLPRAHALYVRSLNTDREKAILLMDEILALPASERLPMSAIAKYRRARLKMSLEDWATLSDADVKQRLAAIRADLASVPEHAREGSLDPAAISENAAYWIAYTRSMILPYERLTRLGEADIAGSLRTYLTMPRRGSANAVNSCLWLAHKLVLEGDYSELVADQDVRLLITLFLSAGDGNDYETLVETDVLKDRRNRWLDALAQAKVSPSFAAAHVAMIQYAAGRWQDCRTSSLQLPADDPLRKLLLSRCQLRLEGDPAASRRLLEPSQATATTTEPTASPFKPFTDELPLNVVIDPRHKTELTQRIQGEAGMLALANGEFAEALWRFEDGRYGAEALYVAECLMSVDELKSHVDRRRASGQPPVDFEKDYWENHENLEQELASRLMRAGQFELGLQYLPDPLRGPAMNYVLLRRAAERTELDSRSRADCHWRSALAIREIGERILHAPYGLSWSSGGGGWYVGYGYYPRVRLGIPNDDIPAPAMKVIGAGPEEKRRLLAWQSEHIEKPDLSVRDARYAAFRHAMQAARLLPDNDPAGGLILQYAGNLLKYRDPKAANPAYVLLVTRFKATPYGQAALKSRWFSSDRIGPPADILSK
jgi:hypothetical protein